MQALMAPTRRDRKKAETRTALRAAALRLVAERGFSNVTIGDIAEAADVSERTFFNYFSSKEAAVVGEDTEASDRLRAVLASRPSDETIIDTTKAVIADQCERFVREAEQVGGSSAQWLAQIKAVHSDPHLRAAAMTHIENHERVILAALAERLGTDPETDPYPTLLAAAAMTATRVAIVYWARSGGSGSPSTLAEEAFVGLAAGLPTDGALRRAVADLRAAAPPGTSIRPARERRPRQ
jgi:AcrR family transcriptional regulator